MKTKTLPLASILFLTLLTLGTVSTGNTQPLTCRPQVTVHFSPQGGATEEAVKEIDAAKAEIFIQAYSFTSAPIAQALINASKRGVKITAVLDKSNRTQKYSAGTFLHNTGNTFSNSRRPVKASIHQGFPLVFS